MKSLLFTLALLVSANAAQAACSIKTDDSHSWIVVGSGSEERLLTIRELFEGMMADHSLRGDLNHDKVSNQIPGEDGEYVRNKNGDIINLSFRSIPTEGKGDPACAKSIRAQYTGLECRDVQMKNAFGLTEGIETEMEVSTSPGNKNLLKRIGEKLAACHTESAAPNRAVPEETSQPAPQQAPVPAARPTTRNPRTI